MSVSMTWRWGTVFLRKMKPESHWTLAWQKNSLLLFHFRSHFYLLLSHSEKVRGRFLEITICPLFQSNFQSFSLMLYPISLSSSHLKLSWNQGDPSENTSSSPKLPHYHPIKNIATQKTSSHWGLWALIMVWIQCHTLDAALNTHTRGIYFLPNLSWTESPSQAYSADSSSQADTYQHLRKCTYDIFPAGMPLYLIWPGGRNGLERPLVPSV